MSWWDKDGEGSDDEDAEGGEGEFNTVNDRIIFLIDGRAGMSERNTNGETHLQNSLTIALAVMKSKIIASGENASIGLAFFGTKDKDAAGGAEDATSSNGVLTLFSLAPPSAQRIRQLQSLIEDPEELKRQVEPHPQTLTHTSACPLKQALWTCSQSFGSNDYRKSDMKRIWIFTNDDSPNSQNPTEQTATITVARDCAQAGIEISLWHIDPAGRSFNPDLFYMNLLRATTATSVSTTATNTVTNTAANSATTSLAAPSNDPASSQASLLQPLGVVDVDLVDSSVQSRIIGAGAEGFDPNMAGVRRKEHKKRRLGSVLFSLTSCNSAASNGNGNGNGSNTAGSNAAETAAQTHMGVMLYKAIQPAKKPNHTWLYARTNEPIKLVSTYLDTATGETLTAERIGTFLEVGAPTESGSTGKVPLNADEMKLVKTLGNVSGVGLQLLYCAPSKVALPLDVNLESSYFLFPDDKAVKGSSLLFEALLRDLAKKDLVGIVRFNRTDSSQPRLAALLPQLEVVDEDGSQISPAGLYLVQLPFSEDVRFNPAPKPAATATRVLDDLYRVTDDTGLPATVRELVEAYTLPDDFDYVRDIQSPALQQYYAVLQALALNQAQPEWEAHKDDNMRPDNALFEGQAEAVLQRFKELTGINETQQQAAPKKRAAPAEGGAAKKARAAPASGDNAGEGGGFSEQEVAGWVQTGQIAGLTVAQLKAICKELGLPVSGVKGELVNRISAKFP